MKFRLGSLVSTPAALRFCTLHQIDLLALVQRHVNGDWGNVCDEDALANDVAVVDGSRILSSYVFTAGKVWVLTDAEDDDGVRASTLVLLPDDY